MHSNTGGDSAERKTAPGGKIGGFLDCEASSDNLDGGVQQTTFSHRTGPVFFIAHLLCATHFVHFDLPAMFAQAKMFVTLTDSILFVCAKRGRRPSPVCCVVVIVIIAPSYGKTVAGCTFVIFLHTREFSLSWEVQLTPVLASPTFRDATEQSVNLQDKCCL